MGKGKAKIRSTNWESTVSSLFKSVAGKSQVGPSFPYLLTMRRQSAYSLGSFVFCLQGTDPGLFPFPGRKEDRG